MTDGINPAQKRVKSKLRLTRQRLLNVAKALRESPVPDRFTMVWYTTDRGDCRTPACAMGHYAARRDLQNLFVLNRVGELCLDNGDTCGIGIDDHHLLRHFGLKVDQAIELFGPMGCNRARTPVDAAAYIERFVEANP